jgi:hypothetical protein
MKKTKRKSPNPTLGGMENYFGKKFKRKGQEISTSDPCLEIP